MIDTLPYAEQDISVAQRQRALRLIEEEAQKTCSSYESIPTFSPSLERNQPHIQHLLAQKDGNSAIPLMSPEARYEAELQAYIRLRLSRITREQSSSLDNTTQTLGLVLEDYEARVSQEKERIQRINKERKLEHVGAINEVQLLHNKKRSLYEKCTRMRNAQRLL